MKRFWLVCGALLAVVVTLAALIFFGLGFFLSPQSNLQKSDAIVVISGGRNTSRAEKGIDLYKHGWAPRLVLSGAALDDGPSNAAVMRQQALAAGVPASAIITEERSQTTYQNATDTKRLLAPLGIHSLILVTSPYHQRRADMTFHHVYGPGYTILGQSSVDDRWSKKAWWKSGFAFNISMDELRKITYIELTGNYQ